MPSVPGVPTFDNLADDGFRILWSIPDNGGSSITGYDVRYRQTGTNVWTDVLNVTLAVTVENLPSNTEYEAQVQAKNSIGNSGYSSSGTVRTLLLLSDLDDGDLDVDFKALISVSGTSTLYADSDRGGTDSPIDGELGVGDSETLISRIAWITSNGRFILNDNDSPVTLDLGTYFDTGGGGADVTFTIMTADGTWMFAVADDRQGGNANAVRFDGLPSGLVVALDNISVGDRMIVRGARPVPDEIELEAEVQSGTPEVAATLTVAPPPDVDIEATITSGMPSVAADLTVALPPDVDLAAEVASGTPVVTADLTIVFPPDVDFEAEVRSGTPSVTAVLTVTPPGDVDLVSEITSGTPEVTVDLVVVLPPNVDLEAEVISGTPVLFANLVVTPPPDVDLEAEITSGIPEVTAALTVMPPGDVSLEAEVTAGSPELSAILSVVLPSDVNLEAEIRSDAPEVTADLTVELPSDVILEAEVLSGTPTLSAVLTVVLPTDVSLGSEITSGVPEVTADLTVEEYVLPSQTITISASDLLTDTNTQKRWDMAIAIDDTFTPSGGLTRYLRRVLVRNDTSSGFQVRFFLAISTIGSPTGAGDDLIEEWEVSAEGIEFSQMGITSLTLPGPANTENVNADVTEGYVWDPPEAKKTDGITFFWTDLDTSQDLTLRFRLPGAEIDLEAEIVSGMPSVEASLTVTPLNAVVLESEIQAGVPEVTAALVVTPPPDVNLEAEVSSGVPTFTADLSVLPSIDLEAEITSGVPELTNTLTVTLPSDVDLEAEITSGTPSVSAALTVVPPGDVALESEVVSGTPAVSANLTVVLPADVFLDSEVLAGLPEITASLTVSPLFALEAQVDAGIPTVAADLAVGLPADVDLEAEIRGGTPFVEADLTVAAFTISFEAEVVSGEPTVGAELTVTNLAVPGDGFDVFSTNHHAVSVDGSSTLSLIGAKVRTTSTGAHRAIHVTGGARVLLTNMETIEGPIAVYCDGNSRIEIRTAEGILGNVAEGLKCVSGIIIVSGVDRIETTATDNVAIRSTGKVIVKDSTLVERIHVTDGVLTLGGIETVGNVTGSDTDVSIADIDNEIPSISLTNGHSILRRFPVGELVLDGTNAGARDLEVSSSVDMTDNNPRLRVDDSSLTLVNGASGAILDTLDVTGTINGFSNTDMVGGRTVYT